MLKLANGLDVSLGTGNTPSTVRWPNNSLLNSAVETSRDMTGYGYGTWTPTSGTANLTVGTIHTNFWSRHGQTIHAQAYFNVSNTSGAAMPAFQINGLPFNCGGHYGWADLYYPGGYGYKTYAYVQAANSYLLISYTIGLPVGGSAIMVACTYLL